MWHNQEGIQKQKQTTTESCPVKTPITLDDQKKAQPK